MRSTVKPAFRNFSAGAPFQSTYVPSMSKGGAASSTYTKRPKRRGLRYWAG